MTAHALEGDKKSLSLSEIHDKLRLSGARITAQREYILDVFFKLGQDCHLSVEDIYRILLRQDKGSISLATVYRTVKTLYGLGILREIDLAEGHKHYELSSTNDHHHHIICLNCNETIEFSDRAVNDLAQKIAEQFSVEVQDVELKIYGKCLHQHAREPASTAPGDLHDHRR